MINKKKNIKILILCQLSYYKNWLVPKVFKKIDPSADLVEIKNISFPRFFNFLNTFWWFFNLRKFLKSDIIILGPFLSPFNGFFLRKIKSLKKEKLIIINHSYENPSIIHNFPLWPHSDYFITPSIFQSPKNFRLPFWWEYIKFGDEFDKNRANKRFGRLIDSDELMSRKISFEDWLVRKNKYVILATHLAHPKDNLIENIKLILPVDGYGPIFDKKIKNYYNSPYLKEGILKIIGMICLFTFLFFQDILMKK